MCLRKEGSSGSSSTRSKKLIRGVTEPLMFGNNRETVRWPHFHAKCVQTHLKGLKGMIPKSVYRPGYTKWELPRNGPLIKNPQFLSNFTETLRAWPSHGMINIWKFEQNWTRIVDLSLIAFYFQNSKLGCPCLYCREFWTITS